jgi:hypothetical protein
MLRSIEAAIFLLFINGKTMFNPVCLADQRTDGLLAAGLLAVLIDGLLLQTFPLPLASLSGQSFKAERNKQKSIKKYKKV